MTRPLMPGGTSVSALTVYSSVAPDGLAGGSPHVHTVASEAYVVVAGYGELHSVTRDGLTVTPLEPGVTAWFEPGVIHRAVNSGGLEIRVVMSHAGLPEAGDAVMTFPDEILADPQRYAEAAALPGPDAPERDRHAAALKRRDLAVEGYRDLVGGAGGAVNRDAVHRFYERTVALVASRLPDWEAIHDATSRAIARGTDDRLAALAAGSADALSSGRVAVDLGAPAYGMCGTLMKTTVEGPS